MNQPGPLTARLYLRLLAIVSLLAWCSIGVQLRLLIGAHGLLPLQRFLDEASKAGVRFVELPTLFWLGASDTLLLSAVVVGALASLLGALKPGRLWLALSLPLYLSVTVAAQDFGSFQWDHLLVEASFLGLFLDWRRPSAAATWMPRLLLFKLYVESGWSKLTSPAHDWLGGTAMSHYFETAPIPTPLARIFHALPPSLLQVSCWATLALELAVPLLIFGPRTARRIAFVLLGGFQLVNFLTANYGFFVPLSCILHLWLLDDETLSKLRLGATLAAQPVPRLARIVATTVLLTWSVLSLCEAQLAFGPEPPMGTLRARLYDDYLAVRVAWAPLRITGVYHLFASVTTDRIEPIIEVQEAPDGPFRELALHYKPGPIDRRAPFVAPHQPRVDFQLWFHGLDARGRMPTYLFRLLAALCTEPARVASLFTTTPPSSPHAVRVRYARYHMTPLAAETPWTREDLVARPALECKDVVPDERGVRSEAPDR